jgi:hypothetical protein|tara:strand:- start:47544 stop:47684 length:141 start_codon:yes stop_codon:yes gene_type:complete
LVLKPKIYIVINILSSKIIKNYMEVTNMKGGEGCGGGCGKTGDECC